MTYLNGNQHRCAPDTVRLNKAPADAVVPRADLPRGHPNFIRVHVLAFRNGRKGVWQLQERALLHRSFSSVLLRAGFESRIRSASVCTSAHFLSARSLFFAPRTFPPRRESSGTLRRVVGRKDRG